MSRPAHLFKFNVALSLGSLLAVAGFPAAAFSSTHAVQSPTWLNNLAAALAAPWMLGCAIICLTLLLIHANLKSNLVKSLVTKDSLS
jgi:hypothetical protein